MFSPARMKRLGVVVLQRDERQAVHVLGQMGVVHLLRTDPGPDTAPLAAPDRSVEITLADSLLSRIDNLRLRLGAAVLPPPSPHAAELDLKQAERNLDPLESRAAGLFARKLDLEHRLGQVSGMLIQVESYRGLDIPLDWMGESRFLHFAIGNLPDENLPLLQSQAAGNVLLVPMEARGGVRPIVAVTSHSAGPQLDALLKEAGFTAEAFPAKEGATTTSLVEDSREERDFLARELQETTQLLTVATAEILQPLADLESVVAIERRVLEAQQHFPRTEQVVLMRGWAPAADLMELRRRLLEATNGRCLIEATDPDDVPEVEIPILLRHPWWLRPFDLLVGAYGLPAYREIEPTLFLAVTYVLMFGMMFGDVGHGLVVAVLGLVLILKSKPGTMRDAGTLLIMLGLASMGGGVVYGSYFGFAGPRLWHEPLAKEATGALMATAIWGGVVLMFVGLCLNTINRFRHGDILGGLLDKFAVAGGVFYGVCLVLVSQYFLTPKAGMPPTWMLVTAGAALAAIAIKEPLHYFLAKLPSARDKHDANSEGGHGGGTLPEALVGAGIEAFDAILGYLSNTISFVRLAAYAMSHAAVLMASMVIADMVIKLVPGVVGSILWVVVVICGNLVAILLEGIVAAVQALRLEYYEFFGKFFTGNGRAFKPFRFPTKEHGVVPQE
jgi:V/A-type H+/Na+-transporting ATPase subunit I